LLEQQTSVDRVDDYGLLNGLARQRLNTDLIANNWDDLLRVAGSLKLGALSASEFMRTVQSGGPWPGRQTRATWTLCSGSYKATDWTFARKTLCGLAHWAFSI